MGKESKNLLKTIIANQELIMAHLNIKPKATLSPAPVKKAPARTSARSTVHHKAKK